MSREKKVYYFLSAPDFPQFLYMGYIGIGMSIYLFFTGDINFAIGIFVAALIILLSRIWVKLDVKDSTISMLFALIPYKKTRLGKVEKVFITEGTMSQTLNSRGNTSTIWYQQYSLYIRSGGENYLLKSGRKKTITAKAAIIARAAKVPLEDYST